LDVIKNHKGDFIVIDILLNGKLKVLSKEIWRGVLHRVEGNIAIFFLKNYDIVDENIIIGWEREKLLNKLLN
jgi:hypothetical protein